MIRNEKTANIFLGLFVAASFLFPFFMDFILHIDCAAWESVKLVLVILFFVTGFIARSADHKRSGEWFKKHRIAQTAVLCFAVFAFGIIFTMVIGA